MTQRFVEMSAGVGAVVVATVATFDEAGG